MTKIKLKECLRWCVKENGAHVLQVMCLEFKPEGGTGQGKYEEVWTNVPLVFSSKIIEKLKANGSQEGTP